MSICVATVASLFMPFLLQPGRSTSPAHEFILDRFWRLREKPGLTEAFALFIASKYALRDDHAIDADLAANCLAALVLRLFRFFCAITAGAARPRRGPRWWPMRGSSF